MTSDLARRALAAAGCGLALAALAGGCGGPPRAQVKGKVTLDGKPVANGAIEFFPTGAAGQTAGATIKDGAYEVEASVGEMKVTVYATEVVGKQKAYDTPDSPTVDVVRNTIPARYNTNTELKANLAEGPNEVNFELTSGPKK